jgi:hypothetical protein
MKSFIPLSDDEFASKGGAFVPLFCVRKRISNLHLL